MISIWSMIQHIREVKDSQGMSRPRSGRQAISGASVLQMRLGQMLHSPMQLSKPGQVAQVVGLWRLCQSCTEHFTTFHKLFDNFDIFWYTSCNKLDIRFTSYNKANQRSDVVCSVLPLISVQSSQFTEDFGDSGIQYLNVPKSSKPLDINFQGPSWKLFDPPQAGINMDQLKNIL